MSPRESVFFLALFGISLSSSATALADSTLTEAAHDLAVALGSPKGAVLVVASPLTTDTPAPRGEELSARQASLVAAALGAEARSDPHPLSLGGARARQRASSGQAPALVYLDVRVASGELRLTADLYRLPENGWDRLRMPAAPPSAHAYAHVPLSAETRSYLAPLSLERAKVTKYESDVGPVLALACGDIDGRGGDELALVTRTDVAWGHLVPGRFVADKKVKTATLGLKAPTPLREPLASAVVVERGGKAVLAVASTDRTGAETDTDLAPRRELHGVPALMGDDLICLSVESGKGGYGGVLDCDTGRPRGTSPTQVFDAFAASDVVTRAGERERVTVMRDPSATLHLLQKGASLEVKDVGAQVALADLDQDGVVEVVTTRASGEDVLTVSSWDGHALAARLHFAAPAGITAVAACPPENESLPPLAIAVGKEIWVVR